MRIYVTSKYEKLYHKQIPVEQLTQPDFIILVDDTVKYQEIMGFGGAFTESACYTLNKMSKENQDKLLNAYYDKEKGLAYNLGRIHMNSCDFSLGNYTYVDQYDEELKSFDIEREFKYVIPTIKRAEAIYGDKIELLISPWSPPAWMKTNNNMNQGGKLKPDYYQSWANYYTKFLEELKKVDIKFFGLTVQNEPAAK